MSTRATAWPAIVGYQHEVMHTGVLAHLLDDEHRGPRLATRLIGEQVREICWYERERRLDGMNGRADLVALLRVADARRDLAVETKVDSNASREQLDNTVGRAGYGVLLAVGITGLHLTQSDLGEAYP